MMHLLPKRRWLRYSVRTLLIAVTILCVWLGYEANHAYRRLQARNRLETSGAGVLILDYEQFDHMMSVLVWRETHPDEAIIDGAYTKLGDGAYRISWIRRLLGDRSIDAVYFERPLS